MDIYSIKPVRGKGYAMTRGGASTKPIAYVRFHKDGRFSVTTTISPRGLRPDDFGSVRVFAMSKRDDAKRAAKKGTK